MWWKLQSPDHAPAVPVHFSVSLNPDLVYLTEVRDHIKWTHVLLFNWSPQAKKKKSENFFEPKIFYDMHLMPLCNFTYVNFRTIIIFNMLPHRKHLCIIENIWGPRDSKQRLCSQRHGQTRTLQWLGRQRGKGFAKKKKKKPHFFPSALALSGVA